MLPIGLAFLAGHCGVHQLATLPAGPPLRIIFIWVALLIFPIAFRAQFRASSLPSLMIAFVLGLGWAWVNAAARLDDDLPAALEGADLLVRGRVASLPDAAGIEPQFEFRVTTAPAGVPARIRLAWYDNDARPLPGELWQFVVRLKRRNGFANPGGFDYEGYLFRQGIGATGYIRNDERNARLAPASALYAVARLRAWIAQRQAIAVGNDPMLGILQGLAIGDTQAMSADQWRVFAATGTTHLMAISGLHISMIAALAAWLGGAIARWRPAQRYRITAIHGQVLCGALAAITYSTLAGLSVPTQRTLAMLCIYFAARACRRELSVGNALGVALIGVLLIDPFAPLAIGAWLSFGAVAVILLGVSGRLVREGTVRSFTRVQLAVTIGLMPLLIVAFGSLSLISPLANAIVIPLFTLIIVPLVLLGTVIAIVWLPAGAVVLGFTTQLLKWFWPALEWSSQLPLAIWHVPQLPVLVYAALFAGAMLFVLPGIWPMRVVAALLCMPALTWRPATPGQGEFKLMLLDVGQGLAVVVHTQSHVLVYDAGPAFRTGRDTGELVVLPYLYSQGVRGIDTLMVSHGDLDHRGGLQSILKAMPVAHLLTGPSVKLRLPQLQHCRRGQRWSWDGVEFEVLHPASMEYTRDNDSSCVLRISAAGGSVLLTGDIQSDGEAALMAAGLARTDVVIAPHHGSRTSSTAGFVAATRPVLALFPAGYRNRWGFPRPDVVQRWREAGAQTLSTPDSGAIEVRFNTAGLEPPRQFRIEQRRYWTRH